MKKFKVGERVYSLLDRKWVYIQPNPHSTAYPLLVENISYTEEGYNCRDHSYPLLLDYNPFFFTSEKGYISIGDLPGVLMEVSHDNKSWHKRYVIFSIYGKYYAKLTQKEEDKDVQVWKYARPIPEKEILTKQQIANLLGKDINSFEIKH